MPSLINNSSVDLQSPQPPTVPSNLTTTLSSALPGHVYHFPGSHPADQDGGRVKRRQVKNACTRCQKACKKCDDARPCLRCVKYGISEECVDSKRKEQRRGVKRGPYKKRDGKGRAVNNAQGCQDVAVPSERLLPGHYVPPPPMEGVYPRHAQSSTTVSNSGESSGSFAPPSYTVPPSYPPHMFPVYAPHLPEHLSGFRGFTSQHSGYLPTNIVNNNLCPPRPDSITQYPTSYPYMSPFYLYANPAPKPTFDTVGGGLEGKRSSSAADNNDN
ncbi:hypothetical protein D9613_002861 [Agrocybe pediades]|uniref:Zn(2)-C6 fungal-type domain-containing protein n=1 Tax=Agrocybe pediades TaxID=84607 RepID=A0A8H4VP00_9AGAR|nr:hypothetical protein D9613_002861 [Agrocybe pediades]KAF9567659.1 hypothetical protein CPC08DRAFT_703184 [Agrocybe pediades]